MTEITLINPRFDQPESFGLRPSAKVKNLGPIILLQDREFTSFILNILLVIFSLGIWLIFFPGSYTKAKIYNAVSQGFKPASKEDRELLQKHGIDSNPINNSDQIGVSRLGSGDHTF